MFCTQCGKEIKKETSFCTYCGFKFDYETKPKVKIENKPKSIGRLNLKSIKFLENPILNFIVLIGILIPGLFTLPIIIPIFLIYFVIKTIFKKRN